MRQVAFHSDAFAQFTDWAAEDRQLFEHIVKLIRDTARDFFIGIGKPEPLRPQLKGYWSRRINQEHRLVYLVSTEFHHHHLLPRPLLIPCEFA